MMGQMHRLAVVLAAALAGCLANVSSAREFATLHISAGVGQYSIHTKNGYIDIICTSGCNKKIHFREELVGNPLGVMQQSDKIDSLTIVSATGSYYHIMVIFLDQNEIKNIFDVFTKSIPNLGVDDDANPKIDIIPEKPNSVKNNNLSIHQIWVEIGDHFQMKTEYLQ